MLRFTAGTTTKEGDLGPGAPLSHMPETGHGSRRQTSGAISYE